MSLKLLRKLREERTAAIDEMTRGQCKDYAHYRERIGFINALDLAIAEAEKSGATEEDM